MSRAWGREAVRLALQGRQLPKELPKVRPITTKAEDRKLQRQELERIFTVDMEHAGQRVFAYPLEGKPVVAVMVPEAKLQEIIRSTGVRVAWRWCGNARVVVFVEMV